MEKIIAKTKYLVLKKELDSIPDTISTINPNKKTVLKEKTNEPKTPDNVLLGLIFVNFFHLNNFPNTYPPISELTVIVIAQINNTKDEVVSFLKNKIESSDDTKITSKNTFPVLIVIKFLYKKVLLIYLM